MTKEGKTGTLRICILQILFNLSLVELLVQEDPPLFWKCEQPTCLVFYVISLAGPRHVPLIWQYFLPGDIFIAALQGFTGGEPRGAGRQKEWKTPCCYGDSSLCNRCGFTTSHHYPEYPESYSGCNRQRGLLHISQTSHLGALGWAHTGQFNQCCDGKLTHTLWVHHLWCSTKE